MLGDKLAQLGARSDQVLQVREILTAIVPPGFVEQRTGPVAKHFLSFRLIVIEFNVVGSVGFRVGERWTLNHTWGGNGGAMRWQELTVGTWRYLTED